MIQHLLVHKWMPYTWHVGEPVADFLRMKRKLEGVYANAMKDSGTLQEAMRRIGKGIIHTHFNETLGHPYR